MNIRGKNNYKKAGDDMSGVLYTVKELAEELRVSEVTVRRYIADGKLKRVDNLSGVRVSREELLRFRGDNDVNPLSPFERKRLELIIQQKDDEIEKLNGILSKYMSYSAEYAMYLSNRNENVN
ncbi:MAG: helix-turn-helix domain-containing protein [Peptostreptococcaceae bacterium]|nr:helix-turn-helix domain-containing protein [Peptostreptococcaceae bacterium]